MENLVELWYLGYMAFVVPAIALIVTVYVWYDARQKGIQASLWVGIGILSIALTLPAAWAKFDLQEGEAQILKNYLEGRAEFTEQFGEDVARAFESIASSLGLTEEIGVDYQSLELYLYLSIAGLAGSVATVIGYFLIAGKAATPTEYLSQTEYQPQFGAQGQTGTYPPTQPGFANYASPLPADNMPAPTGQTIGPAAQMAPHPATEQIDMSGASGYYAPGTGSAGQINSAAMPKTQVLNAVPPTVINACFVVKEGPRTGKLYHLSPEATTLGRDPSTCDIVLDDSSISRQHARVRQSKDENDQDVFTLQDLATPNGTHINGEEIVKQVLKNGDKVTLGRTVLVFKQV